MKEKKEGRKKERKEKREGEREEKGFSFSLP
jgi:hypothetical protein